MKNIIILAYFFPPGNFVGGERPAAWARHLHQFGYYPTIITRNWNEGQLDLTDKIIDNTLKHEVYETHEIYRLPYHRTWRDKLNYHPNNPIAKLIRKSLSFSALILNNFFLRSVPYSNFYDFTKQLIEEHPNKFKLLIASGRPFQLFFIAHLLKKNVGINWLADYRDEWTTFQNNTQQQSVLLRIVRRLEANSEKTWVGSCKGVVSVSDRWQQSISKYVNKPGYVVMNGFNTGQQPTITPINDNNKLEIAYIGTLYPNQDIDLFIQAIKRIIGRYKNEITIKTNFIGIEVIPGQKERIEKLTVGFPENFFIYDRMSKQQLSEFYNHVDLLLATGFTGVKGWYPVKLFEYCSIGIPILLCPSDNDVMEKLITTLNVGFIANSENDCFLKITEIIQCKLNGYPLVISTDQTALSYYSREHQTKILANTLDQL